MHTPPLTAETLFYLGHLPITNAVLATWLAMAVLILLGLLIHQGIRSGYRGVGGGLALLLEAFLGIIEDVLGWPATQKLAALLGTFLLFILVANWMGLLPGFGSIMLAGNPESPPLLRGATTDVHTTFALALISIATVQLWGFSEQGLAYLKKYLNFSGPWYLTPINVFVGLLEIISEGAKVLSFGFRLFGNIFAGEVLIGIMLALVPLLVPIVFYGLELFVGFIQAFVFVILSAVFLKMAGESHSSEGH